MIEGPGVGDGDGLPEGVGDALGEPLGEGDPDAEGDGETLGVGRGARKLSGVSSSNSAGWLAARAPSIASFQIGPGSVEPNT